MFFFLPLLPSNLVSGGRDGCSSRLTSNYTPHPQAIITLANQNRKHGVQRQNSSSLRSVGHIDRLSGGRALG